MTRAEHLMKQAMFAEVEATQAKSSLPEVVDREAVSRLVTEVYLEEWRKARCRGTS